MIGVVTTSYPRFAGEPAGCFVAEHVDWLRNQGESVEVVAAGTGDGAVRVESFSNIFYAGGAPEALAQSPAAWLSAVGFTAAQAAVVARRARRWRSIIAHWLVPCGIVVAACGGRRPFTVVCHSGDVHTVVSLGIAEAAVALVVSRGGRLIFSCSAIRHRLASSLRSKKLRDVVMGSAIVSMGVDLSRFDGLVRQRAPSLPAVTFLGRLVPVKGPDVLLDAWSSLDDRATLRVGGEGPLRDTLEAEVLHRGYRNTEFCGEVRGRNRDRLLVDSDIVVLPSTAVENGRTEGLPVTALEAMAAGSAVVASNTGGLSELPDAVITRCVPGDSRALASALGSLLGDPHRRQLQAAAARKFVRGRSWDVLGPALLP